MRPGLYIATQSGALLLLGGLGLLIASLLSAPVTTLWGVVDVNISSNSSEKVAQLVHFGSFGYSVDTLNGTSAALTSSRNIWGYDVDQVVANAVNPSQSFIAVDLRSIGLTRALLVLLVAGAAFAGLAVAFSIPAHRIGMVLAATSATLSTALLVSNVFVQYFLYIHMRRAGEQHGLAGVSVRVSKGLGTYLSAGGLALVGFGAAAMLDSVLVYKRWWVWSGDRFGESNRDLLEEPEMRGVDALHRYQL